MSWLSDIDSFQWTQIEDDSKISLPLPSMFLWMSHEANQMKFIYSVTKHKTNDPFYHRAPV